jgi:hypothetical protein
MVPGTAGTRRLRAETQLQTAKPRSWLDRVARDSVRSLPGGRQELPVFESNFEALPLWGGAHEP